MGSFKINFEYPWNFEDSAVRQIRDLKNFPEAAKLIEISTFSEISLFFNGQLYTPSWEKRSMNFSDTVYLLDFFRTLIESINHAKNNQVESIWFIDNPISLEFERSGKNVKIWIKEEGKKPEVTISWKVFKGECLKNAEKFLKIILKINRKLVDEPQVKRLIAEIKKAKYLPLPKKT